MTSDRFKSASRWLGAAVLVAACAGIACSSGGDTREVSFGASPSAPGGTPSLTAPAVESPAPNVQLNTLRPTLTVRNGSSTVTGTRTYEFQISDRSDFAASTSAVQAVVSRTGVPEGGGGTTSLTLDQDLPATTRMFWRARVVQGTVSSDWSEPGSFTTRRVGFNRAGELYDPLIHGETIGTIVGPATFVEGQGLRLESSTSYVRYQLPRTVSSGEFSMEVRGLRPNGPGDKLKIFSMLDGSGDLLNSKFQAAAHYRGIGGNPDNCVAFKAVWGDNDIRLEPDLNERSSSVFSLDPNRTYFWQGLWNSNSFRVVIRDGGPQGNVMYDRIEFAPAGTGPYSPSPHFAYLGSNNQAFSGIEVGSWPGVTYTNVWLGDGPRPASLAGSSTR
jgi:hypothetical protein